MKRLYTTPNPSGAIPQNIRTTGFPSPAEKLPERPVFSLNDLLIRNPTSTFCFQVTHDAFVKSFGIHKGDLLVVDRSLMPKPGGILLIEYSGELRLCRYNEVLAQALDDTCLLWGVVTYAIHKTS